MADVNKIVINLSDGEDEELENCNETGEKPILIYIEDSNSTEEVELMNAMIEGYKEMSKINLELCELGLCEDCKQLKNYEARLSESDFLDDSDSEKRRYILC